MNIAIYIPEYNIMHTIVLGESCRIQFQERTKTVPYMAVTLGPTVNSFLAHLNKCVGIPSPTAIKPNHHYQPK